MFRLTAVVTSILLFSVASFAQAAEISYRPSVSIKPGTTVTLKGVRGEPCGAVAPSWAEIAGKLPKSTTGKFSDGGVGTVQSKSCGKSVPARAIKFTATAKGKESFTIFKDGISITVF